MVHPSWDGQEDRREHHHGDEHVELRLVDDAGVEAEERGDRAEGEKSPERYLILVWRISEDYSRTS
jgi:hypothetical protein